LHIYKTMRGCQTYDWYDMVSKQIYNITSDMILVPFAKFLAHFGSQIKIKRNQMMIMYIP